MEKHLKRFYLTGATSSLIVILLTIIDIILGAAIGVNISSSPGATEEKLLLLQQNTLQGLYNLDLLNLVVSFFMILVFISLFYVLKDENPLSALFSLIIFSIGTALFIGNNSALPMLELSREYAVSNEEQKAVLAAVGKALILKGGHGSYGIFPGFVLITLSELSLAIIMLRSKIFTKITSYVGISGTSLLLIYLILVTFFPTAKNIVLALAAPGGILSLVWMIMYTRTLYKLART